MFIKLYYLVIYYIIYKEEIWFKHSNALSPMNTYIKKFRQTLDCDIHSDNPMSVILSTSLYTIYNNKKKVKGI